MMKFVERGIPKKQRIPRINERKSHGLLLHEVPQGPMQVCFRVAWADLAAQ